MPLTEKAIQGYEEALRSTTTAPRKRSHSESAQGADDTASSCSKKKASIKDATKKPAPAKAPSVDDEKAWEEALKSIPRCSAVEGIRETSVFCSQSLPGGGGRNTCLRKLLHEIGSLEQNLPTNPAIFIRFDCETPQFLRALITAPAGTPYALGLFCFDIYIPDNYPNAPPKCHLLTTGNGSVRFSPNLYADGKVCLSLLNTWSGPKWNPSFSSLLQVLISIQGLILGVEHPYYLEPGHGGWEGQVKNGGANPPHVKRHEDKIRVGTLKFALLETLQQNGAAPRHLKPFREVIDAHFYHHRDAIIQVTRDWESSVNKDSFKKTVADLRLALNQLKSPEDSKNGPNDASTSAKGAASKTTGEEGEPSAPLVSEKRREMERAVAKQDYVTAGRLQSEMQHLESGGFEAKIATKRKEMEEAAMNKNYIAAGELQKEVQHLEQQKHLLQDLERRMFAAAASLDYVRAGRFQEQYRILLNPSDDNKTQTMAAASATLSGTAGAGTPYGVAYGGSMPPSIFSVGGAPPSFAFGDTYDQAYDDGFDGPSFSMGGV